MNDGGVIWEGIAALGYEAYGEQTGGKNYQGNPMPKWEDLPKNIQLAWIAAAARIADAYVIAVTA